MSPRPLAIALAFLGACILLLDSAAPLIDRLVIGAACAFAAALVWLSEPDPARDDTADLVARLHRAGLRVEVHLVEDGAIVTAFDAAAGQASTITIAHGRVRLVARSGGAVAYVWTIDQAMNLVIPPAAPASPPPPAPAPE